jgi:ribosomal protein S18 acetylase RimI-like enzyme
VTAKTGHLKHEPVVVRRLRRNDDLRGLVALSRQFFKEYSAHHELFAIGRLQDSHATDYFSKFTTSEDAAAFVAYAGSRAVGYVTVLTKRQPPFNRVKRVGAVSGLMVAKSYRRHRVALRLWSRVNRFLRQRRVKYFTVYTAVTNAPALLFYRRVGMVPFQLTMLGAPAPCQPVAPKEAQAPGSLVSITKA